MSQVYITPSNHVHSDPQNGRIFIVGEPVGDTIAHTPTGAYIDVVATVPDAVYVYDIGNATDTPILVKVNAWNAGIMVPAGQARAIPSIPGQAIAVKLA